MHGEEIESPVLSARESGAGSEATATALPLQGGRIAEELIFGPSQVTSGATNDLKQATTTARHMVMDCGMSDVLGPVDVKLLARSPETEQAVDREVTRLVRESYDRVFALMRANADCLHAVAAELMEHETLDKSQIEKASTGLCLAPTKTTV